jgi:hypothetical protein
LFWAYSLAILIAIWFLGGNFGTYFPVLVCCTKKNLATLIESELETGFLGRNGGRDQPVRKVRFMTSALT